jgi:hypothetical protein
VQFEIVDNCPVPAELAEEIRAILNASGVTLNSCDRSPDAEPFLEQCAKMSQRQLYEGFVSHRRGCNPRTRPAARPSGGTTASPIPGAPARARVLAGRDGRQ